MTDNLNFDKMKNQLRYITFLLLAVFIGSCEDEEKSPLPEITRGSVPVFAPEDSDTGFINFMDFDATNISFNVDKQGSEDVTSIDVWVQFNNSETGESEIVTYNTVSSFPQEFHLTFDQLINLFPDDVLTEDTLNLGDSFIVGG